MAATSSVDYYLTVSGLDGGEVVAGHVGAFDVADFSFDIDALTSWTSGGGASVGKPNPAPLIIDLKPGADLNGFIQDITQGKSFPHVRLEGVTAAANGAQTVYDLRLDGVFVTKVTDTNGVDHLELVYKAVSLTTTAQNPNGTLGTPQTIGWNVPTGTTFTTPLQAAVAGTSGGAANPVDYYLTVSGLDGGEVVAGHVGAFDVADFSFDIDALTSWTSGGGASVGKPNPAPLIIDLKPGADLNGFIQDITQGKSFPHVRLEGVTAAANGAQTVYDLRLDGVFVTKVTDTNGVDHLELVYKAVSLTTTAQNPNGTLGTPQTIGWNVPTGTTFTTPLQAAVAGTSGGAANPVDYYLTVSGLDGGEVVAGHVGAFDVADFSFDIDALTSWTSGGGASVGKPNPAPLIIDLKPGADLNGFIQDITQGKSFPHVRLEGVTAAANGAQTVYDLRLDGVFVTKVTDTNGVDHLELVYKAVSLTTTAQNPNGTLGTPQTIGWNVPTGTTFTTPLQAAVAGTSGGAANPVDYYLTVSGLDGGEVVAGHVGAFDVADFSFDIDALTSWTSGGGASVGKPNPAPLIIDLKPGADLNGFIQDITQGKSFPHVRLEGVTAAANGAQTVYDLRLDGVFVTKVTDTNGVDHLELVYKAVSLTTTAQNPNGTLGTPQTIGWNVPTGTTFTTPLQAAVAGTSGGAANPVDYYLTVSGLDGGEVVAGHVGAFDVADFSFDIDALTSWTSGGGASVGKPNPAPLIIDLKPGADLNGFIQDITQGKSFPHVRLEGVTAAANGAQTVYDLRLDGVFVTKVTDTNGVDHLELVYKAVSLTTTAQNPNGTLGTPQTIGWNVPTGTTFTTPLQAAVAGTSGGAANPVDYYLTVSGLDGGEVVAGHVGAFDVADFSFDIDALTSWTSGGGASVGKPNPAPLIIDLKPGADLNGFIQDITQGKSFPHVRLEGVTAAANGAQTVYDLRLDGVFVTKVTDTNGVDHLELVYKAVSLTTTAQNPNGTLGTPQTIGWNVPTGTTFTTPLQAAVAGTSNHAPVVADDTSGALAGGTVAGNVLANDHDPDGDSLTVSAVAVAGLPGNVGTPLAGKYGDLTLKADGSFSYAADNAAAIAAGPTGSHLHDIFSYTANDGLGGTSSASLDITLDRLPVAVNDTSNALAGGTVAGNVLANDHDPDGDSLTVSAVAVAGLPGNVGTPLAGKYGDLTLKADGSFSYAADNAAAIAAGPTGTHLHDIFSYTANDGLGGTPSASLDITLDRLPVAVDDTSNALAGGTVAGKVLANDHDPDGDSLTVSAVAVAGLPGNVGTPLAGKYGDLTLKADGSFSYAADNAAAIAAGPTGSHLHDIFSYTANDGLGGTSSASLDITLDRPPVAINDLAGVQVGKTISGNVLANDHDPDGDLIQLSLGQSVAGKYGSLVLMTDGTYNYTSNKDASLPSQGAAQDSFTYTENDGHGGVAQATLSVTVVPNGMNYIAGAPGATITSGNGKSIIDSSLGGQTVLAGNGKDTIVGGPHDMLTGGNGPDTFEFGPFSGPNTIRDFDVHNDVIEFDQSPFASFTDMITAHTQQVGLDAVITYHGTDTLTLQHVTVGSLHPSDFLLA